jgi:hypothetical protein
MANYEIDCFVSKFKVLCQAGRSASLTLSSNAGKASLNLSVDLGVLPDEGLHHPHHPRNHSRNGPARQRQREKRAAARRVQAEEAEEALNAEEKKVLEMAERAALNSHVQESTAPAKAAEGSEGEKVVIVEAYNDKTTKTSDTEIVDEVCSDSVYESRLPDDTEANPKPENGTSKSLKPPPVRGERSLGGIDYYTLTYEDPSDEEIY